MKIHEMEDVMRSDFDARWSELGEEVMQVVLCAECATTRTSNLATETG